MTTVEKIKLALGAMIFRGEAGILQGQLRDGAQSKLVSFTEADSEHGIHFLKMIVSLRALAEATTEQPANLALIQGGINAMLTWEPIQETS